MVEISYSAQSASVRNAYRDGAYLVLGTGSSLPDVCVACGNAASGNVIHKGFDDRDLWIVLPTPIDVIYAISESIFGKRYVFDFPFCPDCPPDRFQLAPTRLDRRLAVFVRASQSFLNLLPPMPHDVAAERSRDWLQRKLRWLNP
jgi:hypothetical protein